MYRQYAEEKYMTEWHTIRNYNKHDTYEKNRENGVDIPLIDSDVLVIYPDISDEVYVKVATETGMSGTSYYEGTMWAYYDKPENHK